MKNMATNSLQFGASMTTISFYLITLRPLIWLKRTTEMISFVLFSKNSYQETQKSSRKGRGGRGTGLLPSTYYLYPIKKQLSQVNTFLVTILELGCETVGQGMCERRDGEAEGHCINHRTLSRLQQETSVYTLRAVQSIQ